MDLLGARLAGANLAGAFLESAALIDTDLRGADLSGTRLGRNVLGEIDFRNVKGLDSIMHLGPSTVGLDTLRMSCGKIPNVFLRGCGLQDWEIEASKLYDPDLKNEEIISILYRVHHLRCYQAIQVNPLFISYNHTDTSFVEKLETRLIEKGIRFWRDVHDATAGRLEKQVDRAIRLNPTVLLVLSTSSVRSEWVEHEFALRVD